MLRKIPIRKLSVKSIVNKSTPIRLTDIFVYPDSTWVGTRCVAFRRERFPEMVAQLEYVKNEALTMVGKDKYDETVDGVISTCTLVEVYPVGWVTLDEDKWGAFTKDEKWVVLSNSNKTYVTIPYEWFKLFYDGVKDLKIYLGIYSSLIFKEEDQTVGISMPCSWNVQEKVQGLMRI